MSEDRKPHPPDKHRDSEGRLLRHWGHLEVTDEQRDFVARRMAAWRIYHETGDKSALLELGIQPPPTRQQPKD